MLPSRKISNFKDKKLGLFDNRILEKACDHLLTPVQLALKLQMTISGIYKLVAAKKIPAMHVGRSLRFNWDEVLTHLKGG